MSTAEQRRQEIVEATGDDALERLRSYENVHSASIGLAKRNGRYTEDVKLTVRVSEKLAENKLDSSEIIPETVDGVETDVIEEPRAEGEFSGVRNDRVRPLVGGIHGSGVDTGGTIGGIFETENGRTIGITARHVACAGETDCSGSDFHQPAEGHADGEVIGTTTHLGTWSGTPSENLDVAIVEIQGPDAISDQFAMDQMAPPEPDPELGELYVCPGPQTGLISGRCVAKDVSASIGYSGVDGGIDYVGMVRFDRPTTVGSDWSGNSGALHGTLDRNGVLTPNALHIGGNDDTSFAHPWSKITDRFGTLSPSFTGTQSSYSSASPSLETGILRVANHPAGVSVSAVVANGGGDPSSPTTIECLDESGSTIATEDVEPSSASFAVVQFELPPSEANQQITITSPHGTDEVVDVGDISAGYTVDSGTRITRSPAGSDEEIEIGRVYRGDDSGETLVWQN